MGKRQETLVLQDIRGLLRLVNALHELPGGGEGRRRAMLEGLCDLVGASAGESLIVEISANGESWVASSVRADTTAADAGRRRGHPPAGARTTTDPAIDALVKLVRENGATMETRTAGELPGNPLLRGRGGDAIYSARVLTTNAPEGATRIAVVRLEGIPALANRAAKSRECRILHLFHSEAGWVYDEPPPPPPPPESVGLTDRQRECLRQLLAGRGEKEIASAMGLSPHTVHVHVKAIYRQIGVSTRGELMARFLRRRGTKGHGGVGAVAGGRV